MDLNLDGVNRLFIVISFVFVQNEDAIPVNQGDNISTNCQAQANCNNLGDFLNLERVVNLTLIKFKWLIAYMYCPFGIECIFFVYAFKLFVVLD